MHLVLKSQLIEAEYLELSHRLSILKIPANKTVKQKNTKTWGNWDTGLSPKKRNNLKTKKVLSKLAGSLNETTKGITVLIERLVTKAEIILNIIIMKNCFCLAGERCLNNSK